jgi:hypothetical protein
MYRPRHGSTPVRRHSRTTKQAARAIGVWYVMEYGIWSSVPQKLYRVLMRVLLVHLFVSHIDPPSQTSKRHAAVAHGRTHAPVVDLTMLFVPLHDLYSKFNCWALLLAPLVVWSAYVLLPWCECRHLKS